MLREQEGSSCNHFGPSSGTSTFAAASSAAWGVADFFKILLEICGGYKKDKKPQKVVGSLKTHRRLIVELVELMKRIVA